MRAKANSSVTRDRELVVQTWIDVIDWPTAISRILGWARGREAKYVTICNVHSVITGNDDQALRAAINQSDLATPDGKPVAWLLGRRRHISQPRVNGPDLTLALCEAAAQEGLGIAFYGSSPATLEALRSELARRIPALRVELMISPPFRQLADTETKEHLAALNASGASIVFVGLGCPKQEVWMAQHSADVRAVLIGVGAAFDYIAGTVKRPPVWMQRAGLEWLGRLIAEPRRLWRRYLVTNTLYVFYIFKEVLGLNRHNAKSQ